MKVEVGRTDIRKEEVESARSRLGGTTRPSSRVAVGAKSTAISAVVKCEMLTSV